MRTLQRLLAFCVAPALVPVGCGSSVQSQAVPAPRGVPVRTAAVEVRDLEENLVLTGSLKPRAQVQVVAEVAARLLRVVRDEGSRAARGELLAVLDDTDYRLAHARARAALEVAEANRAHALVEKERADNLLKTGGITDKDHLAAQVGLRVAQAALAQASAEAEISAVQLARCQIRAPFTGRVAKRSADPGAMLASGAPLLTLVDASVFEFRGSVPSADYGKVVQGAPVALSLDALGGRTVEGRVARIVPLVEERTRAFEVVVEVPSNPDLVGGLFARAVVRVGAIKDALVVPPQALLRDGAQGADAHVFVVSRGQADRRAVRLGVEAPQAVQVTEGLAAGEQVVLDPPVSLGSGAPVDVQSDRK